jgi:hypothetical protein
VYGFGDFVQLHVSSPMLYESGSNLPTGGHPLTEKERVIAAIARIEAKRDAQADPLCRRYYELCLIGWRRHLARLG